MKVKVLAKDGQELMPTTIEKANKLIAKGEAELLEESPMTIRMLKNTKRYKQETLGGNYKLEKTNDYIIPIGKADDVGEAVDVKWSLNMSKEKEPYIAQTSTMLIAGNGSYSKRDEYVHNIIASLNYTPNLSVVYTNRLNGRKYSMARNVRGSAGNDESIARTAEMLRKVLTDRFKLMEEYQIRDIMLLRGQHLAKYELFDKEWDWDAIFTVVDNTDVPNPTIDGTKGTVWNRNYYSITIQEMYENLYNGTIEYYTLANPIKGVPRHIFKFDIQKIEKAETKEAYSPHKIVLILDELQEVMYSSNYKAVDILKKSLVTIAQLGRAAGIHMVISCARPTGGVVPKEVRWSSEIRILSGDFDAAESTLMFDRDVSHITRDVIQFRYSDLYEMQPYNLAQIDNWDDMFDITKSSIEEIQENTGYAKDFDLTVKPSKELLDKIEEHKKEYAEFVKETEYVYLSKSEVKERLLKKINSLKEEIDSIKEDIDMLFSELDNIIE